MKQGHVIALAVVAFALAIGLYLFYSGEKDQPQQASVPAATTSVAQPTPEPESEAEETVQEQEPEPEPEPETAQTESVGAQESTQGEESEQQAALPTAEETSEPAQEEAETETTEADTSEVTEEEVAPVPTPDPPAFGLLRVEKDGSSVIAGTAPPGSTVVLFDGDQEIGRAVVGPSGDWVILPDAPLAPGSHALRLVAVLDDGQQLAAANIAIVAVPEPQPVVQAQAEPTPEPQPEAKAEEVALEEEVAQEEVAEEEVQEESVVEAAQAEVEAVVEAVVETAENVVEQEEAKAEETTVSATEETASIEMAEASSEEAQAALQAASEEAAAAAEQVTETSDEVAQVAQAAAESNEPLVVLVPDDGQGATEVVQGGLTSLPEKDGIKQDELSLKTVDYDEDGAAIVTGSAAPGSKVVVYLGDEQVAEVQADEEGNWPAKLDKEIEPGVHDLTVAQLDEEGAVVSEVKTPFARAEVVGLVLKDGQVIVQPGNSLWRIARRVYGQGIRYSVIYQANDDQISNPDLIFPGQVFTIPTGE